MCGFFAQLIVCVRSKVALVNDHVFMSMIKSDFHVDKRQIRNFFIKPHELIEYKNYDPNCNSVDRRIRELKLKLRPIEMKNGIHLNEEITNKIKKTLEQKVSVIKRKSSKENLPEKTNGNVSMLKKNFSNNIKINSYERIVRKNSTKISNNGSISGQASVKNHPGNTKQVHSKQFSKYKSEKNETLKVCLICMCIKCVGSSPNQTILLLSNLIQN